MQQPGSPSAKAQHQTPTPAAAASSASSSSSATPKSSQKGSVLARVFPARTVSQIIQEHKKYKLLLVDQETLSRQIIHVFATAEALLTFIETRLAKGFLEEAHFIELLSNPHYSKDIKVLKKMIDSIFTKIIDIYADAITSLNQQQIKSIKVVELVTPKTSNTLKNICFAQSDNLVMFIVKNILGFDSEKSCRKLVGLISDKQRVYQRTLRLQLWIAVAKKLKDQRNEMGCLIVLQGIAGQPVRRLKKTKSGLSNNAKEVLKELLEFEEQMINSREVKNYYLNSLRKVPFIPSVFLMLTNLLEINEKADDVAFVAGREDLWDKIRKFDLKGDEVLRLLLEQHSTFARVIPCWEFVASHASRVETLHDLENLRELVVIPQCEPAAAEQVSYMLEVLGAPDPAPDEYEVVPEGLLECASKKELIVPKLSADELNEFKMWFGQSYVSKLKTLYEKLVFMRQVINTLKESNPNQPINYNEFIHTIGKEFCIIICQLLHVPFISRHLGAAIGFAKLGINEQLLNETEGLIQELAAVLPEVKSVYYEVRDLNIVYINETQEVASLKADIADTHGIFIQLYGEIEEYLKAGSFHQLKETKRKWQELNDIYRKYADLLTKANAMRKNFGEVAFLETEGKCQNYSNSMRSLGQLLSARELSYLSDTALIDIINNIDDRLKTQVANCNSLIIIPEMKKKKEVLLKALEVIDDLLLELPLSVEKKDYYGKDHFLQQLIELRREMSNLITHCHHDINDINIRLQRLTETKRNIISAGDTALALVTRSSIINRLRSLSRVKITTEQDEMICRVLNLPNDLKVGKFAKSGSIFDSLARILNVYRNDQLFDESILRQRCHAFYLRHKDEIIGWPQNAEVAVGIRKDHYYKVQYTQGEMAKFFKRTAIVGTHLFEGRMLCAILAIPAIYVARITHKPKNNAIKVRYTKVTAHGIDSVDRIDVNACIACKTPVLLLHQDGFYSPILPKPIRPVEVLHQHQGAAKK